MAQEQDLDAVDLRLYRLELQMLGVELAEVKLVDDEKPGTRRMSHTPSPSKSQFRTRLFDNNDNEDAVLDTQPLTKTSETDDFVTRLTALEQMVASKSSSHRDTWESQWKEIDQYLQDLDPGAALTHQQQIAAPLVYRRQEVLASADELKRNMQYVTEILNLLLIGQTNVPKSSDLISEMHVTKAPILMTAPALSRQEQEKLAELEATLQGLRDRADTSAAKLDRILTGYQKLVSAASEKLVLLDEEIRLHQKQ